MTASHPVTSQSNVTLREITAETVREICRLSDTLSPVQQRMVAPNAVSIAEAHFSNYAWFRAIYADETPVGFIMLYIGPDDDTPEQTVHFLWRFMIAGPFQGFGFGKAALQIVIADLRAQGVEVFITSCGQGEGSPEGFYRKMGFLPTGEMAGSEMVLKLELC
jgi:diamine N-acetyltransferase